MPDTIDTLDTLSPPNTASPTISSPNITQRLDQDTLQEGWAEHGGVPRVLATLKMGAKTDLGRVRDNNEDKWDFFEPEDPATLAAKGAFYAVADGMGGHSAGQIACELALKTVIQAYYASPPSADVETALRRAIEEANALVYETAQAMSERQGMGTTLTCAVVREDQVTLAQVGDSRAYLLRGGRLSQVTQDHSWVAEQVRMGIMTETEAQASPFRNIITRSVGTAQTVEPELTTQDLQAGDTLLLCSDGLSGAVEQPALESVLRDYSPSEAAMRLVDEANRAGGRDNITAVVLSVRAIVPVSETVVVDEAADAPSAAKTEKRGWGRRK